MKNFIRFIGPIALVVVIGFTAVSYVSAQDYSSFLNQAPFRDGVFKNPAYEEVNSKFPLSFKLLFGDDGKVFGSFYTYRQIYMEAEKALVEKTTTDADFDMFRMAYSYEILSCIGDYYVSKKKLKIASDDTIDNQVLKNLVSEKVQAAPAELWKFLLFASKTYVPATNDFKGRVAFAKKYIFKGDSPPIALTKWGFVSKIFNEYREGKHADKKVK
jgi:hypothetical protein